MSKKRLYILYLILLVTLITLKAFCSVFDSRSRALVNNMRQKNEKLRFDKYNKVPDTDDSSLQYIPAVLELADADSIYLLEDIGCKIMRSRENFVIACIPVDQIDRIEGIHTVLRASSSQALCSNNLSREFSHIPQVHSRQRNDGLTGYTGRGVAVGFCDTGFDPTHCAFEGRIGRIVDYHLAQGKRIVFESPQQIAGAEADRDYQTHGTHVANIIAGGTKNNPYYGYAPEATIVATTSDLYDASLLCGIEDIIDYAKEHNMPAVANLSVGCFTGPHDGTDVANRYLGLLAQEIPICFSAGNFGDYRVYFKETFKGDSVPVGSFYEEPTWNGMNIRGINDIWSSDSRRFEVSVAIYDYIERKFVYVSPWFSGDFKEQIDSESDQLFARCYHDSRIHIYGGHDSYNGRYNITLSYELHSTGKNGPDWSRYYTVARLRGEKGVTIESFIDGSQSFFHSSGVIETRAPQVKGGISNFCYAPGVISIGAYNSRNSVTLADGSVRNFDFNTGEIATWSSYGTNIYGDKRPLFSAPGNQIISAMSDRFYKANPDDSDICCLRKGDNGKEYRWYYECGTSMSSPAVAGTFATWLEADPTLSPGQLTEIALSTVRTSGIPDLTDPRWGAGAIDAAAGLDKILSLSVKETDMEYRYSIYAADGKITVSIPGCDNPQFSIFDISGKEMPSSGLSNGLYIIKINNPIQTSVKISVN